MSRSPVTTAKSNPWVPLTSLALTIMFVLASVGCKEPRPSADSVDSSLVGQWRLDTISTRTAQFKMLKDQKLITNQGEKEEFERSFASVYFDLELAADATWSCKMGDMLENGEFSGYWTSTEDTFLMVQTHEGAKKKKDRMSGRIENGKLHLIHKAQGIEVPYIFEQLPSADQD